MRVKWTDLTRSLQEGREWGFHSLGSVRHAECAGIDGVAVDPSFTPLPSDTSQEVKEPLKVTVPNVFQ